ncbi:MAG: bifunctional phosphoribosylaminoimidazolecarboxamide formyltransferase/IMP cyclohydrolase, partial [Alphaproteobacteria bacterium]|nr:bifunctional phosphoribosylaminoimidazolecarboxamide formyltransferase/IMP cyclohydrolase [Alphaproteobacteria bacterium]
AKNHAAVTVITSVNQYDKLIEELSSHDGGTGLEFRKHLAAAAYAHTAQYDSAISTWFAKQLGEQYPEVLNISARKKQDLRYGENPHQSAAFYSFNDNKISSIATASIIQGKPLSYNNIGDTDAAFDLISEFKDAPAVAIIKHANPCGVATGATLLEAYQKAFNCDTVSPFGGIIACNKIITKDVAEAITKIFSEVIIAPDADDEAKAVFAAKPNVRVLTTGSLPDPLRTGVVFRSVSGGVLLQSRDNIVLDNAALKCVTKRQPTAQELKDLVFAFTVAKHVKSNTIVYAKQGATVGIGAGQMNRLDSAVIAAKKAKDTAAVLGLSDTPTNGSVAASDAFFPFADGLEAIVSAGATAVIQPGGSIKDNEVIDAANKHNLAMIFTGIRHFRH